MRPRPSPPCCNPAATAWAKPSCGPMWPPMGCCWLLTASCAIWAPIPTDQGCAPLKSWARAPSLAGWAWCADSHANTSVPPATWTPSGFPRQPFGICCWASPKSAPGSNSSSRPPNCTPCWWPCRNAIPNGCPSCSNGLIAATKPGSAASLPAPKRPWDYPAATPGTPAAACPWQTPGSNGPSSPCRRTPPGCGLSASRTPPTGSKTPISILVGLALLPKTAQHTSSNRASKAHPFLSKQSC